MKEVDEALARAFAKREQSDPRPKVPPAPHWPVRRKIPHFPRFIHRTRGRNRSSFNGRQWFLLSSTNGATDLKSWRG